VSKPPIRGRQRVHTARSRTAASTRWLDRQLNDPYVRRAKAEGMRSRAAYKLIELDERFSLLKGAQRIVDLGIAPGGWAQVVRRFCPRATLVGIDLMDETAPGLLATALGGPADLVLSDMAANTVGHARTDHLRTMGLVEAAAAFAGDVLRPGGAFVGKVLAGGADASLVAELKRGFATVRHARPPASRRESSEWYVIAQGFKGTSG
jgi:23S rRNA (uridine2552-2'-O)-methyltransferase